MLNTAWTNQQPKRFNHNNLIINEGQPNNIIYIVASGSVALYENFFEGKPKRIAEKNEGQVFGELSAFSGKLATYTAIAGPNCSCYMATQPEFEMFLKFNPSLSYDVIKYLCAYSAEYLPQKYDNKPAEKPKPAAAPAKDAKNAAAPAPAAPVIKIEGNGVIVKKGYDLYPEGHKSFDIDEPETFKSYICDYEVKCPCCGEKITVKSQLWARFRLTATDYDLRKHISNFEPLWFNIWTCPNCYYSTFYNDFEESLPRSTVEELTQILDEIKSNVKLTLTSPKTVDQVFAQYYLALKTAQAVSADNLFYARLWMQLSWLYIDCDDNKMSEYAGRKALECYNKAYYESHTTFDPQNEQQILMVLSELNVRYGDKEKALNQLYSVKTMKEGARIYKYKAEMRIDEIREIMKAERKTSQNT